MDIPVGNEGSLTGTSPMEVVPAPGVSVQHIVPSNGLSVYNADSVARDIIISKNKAGTRYVVWKESGVPAGTTIRMEKVVTLDDTDESLEVKTDATATTTEPTFDVSYGACS